MFTNYFFVPANKEKHLKKSAELSGISHRIFDFEDSILASDVDSALRILSKVERKDTDWARVPLSDKLYSNIVSSMGYTNIVIPKFTGFEELSRFIEPIIKINKKARFILLIEHPRALVELQTILDRYSSWIHGMGLGSHDFSWVTGMANDLNLLRHIRVQIMVLAKAYEIEAIDVASMNISDESSFRNEILDGFNCGYRSKFLIHPFQLNILNSFSFYSYEEFKKYQEILRYYEDNVKGTNALFSYEGKVYEKMHIESFKKIVEWGECVYGTDR